MTLDHAPPTTCAHGTERAACRACHRLAMMRGLSTDITAMLAVVDLLVDPDELALTERQSMANHAGWLANSMRDRLAIFIADDMNQADGATRTPDEPNGENP